MEDLYYHQFTQGVLWPLFHGIPTNFNEGLLDNFQGQYEVSFKSSNNIITIFAPRCVLSFLGNCHTTIIPSVIGNIVFIVNSALGVSPV